MGLGSGVVARFIDRFLILRPPMVHSRIRIEELCNSTAVRHRVCIIETNGSNEHWNSLNSMNSRVGHKSNSWSSILYSSSSRFSKPFISKDKSRRAGRSSRSRSKLGSASSVYEAICNRRRASRLSRLGHISSQWLRQEEKAFLQFLHTHVKVKGADFEFLRKRPIRIRVKRTVLEL
ncbi:hypothetical protein PNOK_0476700 [Pyrrhoderma noxium]|uniref:Uncharacterized protein n=1 Tax=Pyrrhoderma noxium TaxID=2282107 RepID=A0A286UJM6_9AGAM|nr:hypothetical protein PNOK_0476700 [Pyrrhoderma noxium]